MSDFSSSPDELSSSAASDDSLASTGPVQPPSPAAGGPPGYPPSYGYPPQMPMGMPPGYGMPQGYGMPMPMPPGYPMTMPPGYAMPPGYGQGYPPGYPMPPVYPGLAPGYPGQHLGYPGQHAGYPMQQPLGYAVQQPGYPAPSQGYPAQGPHTAVAMAAPIPLAQAVPEVRAVAVTVVAEPAAAPQRVVASAGSSSSAAAEIEPEVVGEVRSAPLAARSAALWQTEPALVPLPRGDALAVPTSASTQKRSGLRQLWQKVGGGSLTLSLLIHAGLLVIAGLVVFTSAIQDKTVDFLPGGGTQQGQQASQDLQHRVQQKKRSKVNQNLPKSRIVSTSLTSALTLPEAPPDMLDLPSASLAVGGGGKLGAAGGFGTAGAGGGFGGGLGLGGAKGFVGMTLFGKLGGEGMPGVFYDMKQTPDRVATALADLASEGDFANVINTAAGKKFSGKGLDQFFHSTQKMSFTYLLIPYMSAGEGPKAFKVENEVQPRAWMVHYTADIRPPVPGDYRFVGLFDDALVVYVNGRPVLDGSWYPLVDYGEKRKDGDIRQDFGGPVVPGTGARRCYAGKWVKLEGLTRIDIVVGERPGGRVGGLLLVQAKKGKYAERADGTPILPVFAIGKPTLEDEARLNDYTASGFEVAKEPAVFSLTKDIFGGK